MSDAAVPSPRVVQAQKDALEKIRTTFFHDLTVDGRHIFEDKEVMSPDECPVCIAKEGLGYGVR